MNSADVNEWVHKWADPSRQTTIEISNDVRVGQEIYRYTSYSHANIDKIIQYMYNKLRDEKNGEFNTSYPIVYPNTTITTTDINTIPLECNSIQIKCSPLEVPIGTHANNLQTFSTVSQKNENEHRLALSKKTCRFGYNFSHLISSAAPNQEQSLIAIYNYYTIKGLTT
jgi:hypothetical protein